MQRELTKTCAARTRVWRSLIAGIGVAAVAGVSSCNSAPPISPDRIATHGANGTMAWRHGPLLIVHTESIVPGLPASGRGSGYRRYRCENPHNSVSLLFAPALENVIDPHEVCHAALASIARASLAVPYNRRAISLTVELVAPGELHYSSHWSVSVRGRLAARYTVPVPNDHEAFLYHLVATLAHETTHLLRQTGPRPRVQRDEEQLAYLVAACAQLPVVGSIRLDDLPTGQFTTNDDLVPGSAVASSVAGAKVTQALSAFFSVDPITLGSPQATRLSRYCDETILDYGSL